MAEGGGAAGGAGSEYKLSATLEMRDQLSGKLRSAVSQIKSVDKSVSKLGGNSEISRLAKQLDTLGDLRRQVNEFKELKKSVASTQQAYNQANSATAELAKQYKQGQSATSQLKAKQAELQKTFEQSQSATSQLKSKLGELKAEVAKAKSGMAEGYDKLQAKIQSTQSASAQLKSKLGELRAEAAKAKKSGATEEYKNLQSQIKSTQSAAGQLKTQLGNLKSEAAKVKSGNASEAYRNLQSQIKSTAAELKASQAMTQKTGAELKSLASGIKQAERELANIGTSFDQSKKKAAQLKQELKSQQPTLNEMRKSLASQGFNTRDFINSNRKLREQMATATRDFRTQQLRETLSAAGMKLSGGNVNVNVSGNATSKLGSIKKELQSITQKTWNVAVNAKNAIGGKVNEFANGAMLGMGAQMLGTAGVGYGLIDSVQTYRNFEKQIARNVALATPGMSGAETTAVNERFSAAARYYGATTPLTAEQIGKAQEYAIIAGWDADKILGQSFKNGDVNPVMGAEGALKPIIQASIASGEDLAMVSDIITDSMTAMGYKAGQIIPTTNGQLESTQHFVDVLMKTTVSANTNFQQLGLAMKYAAPLAHTAGYNIEDMAVALGLMANNGIKADQAGTGMRGILNRFINEPKKAAEAFDTLGISMEDTNGKIKGFMPLMMEVRSKLRAGDKNIDTDSMMDFMEKTTGETIENREEIKAALEKIKSEGGLSKKEMMQLGSSMSGTYALSAFMALINSEDEDIQTLMEKVYHSRGTTQEMFDKMSQTLDFDIESFKSAFADLQIEFMTGNGGQGLRNFFQGLTEDVNYFKNSLKDGFDISDIGGVVARMATQLKNKFLEFDGVGSILAGGALAMGLKKIYNLTMQLKNAAMTTRDWYRGTATNAPPTVGGGKGGAISQSVGSMVIHANSVVVNGKAVSQGAGSAAGGTVAGSGANSRGGTPTTGTTSSRLGGFAKNALKIGGAASLLTAAFSIADTYSTRSINEGRVNEAQSALNEAQKQYNEIAANSERSEELPSATENL